MRDGPAHIGGGEADWGTRVGFARPQWGPPGSWFKGAMDVKKKKKGHRKIKQSQGRARANEAEECISVDSSTGSDGTQGTVG